jgi:hypothetical protein
MDVVEGKGPEAQHRNLVTVKYKLTAGKFGATIDIAPQNLAFDWEKEK